MPNQYPVGLEFRGGFYRGFAFCCHNSDWLLFLVFGPKNVSINEKKLCYIPASETVNVAASRDRRWRSGSEGQTFFW